MDTKRSFCVVRVTKTNGNEIHVPTGRYISSSARSAAEKAFTQITREKNIESGTLLITMKETTRGSKGKTGSYHLTKQLRSQPIELNGRTIRYETFVHAIAPIVAPPPPPPPLRRANVALQHARSGANWNKAATKMRARSAFLKPIYRNIPETVPQDIQELYDNMQLNPHNKLEPFEGDYINRNALFIYLLQKHKNDCVIMSSTSGMGVCPHFVGLDRSFSRCDNSSNQITIRDNEIIKLPTETEKKSFLKRAKSDYSKKISIAAEDIPGANIILEIKEYKKHKVFHQNHIIKMKKLETNVSLVAEGYAGPADYALGVFEQQEEVAWGRPTFKKNGQELFLFYTAKGKWLVGSNTSATFGAWEVASTATTPDAITEEWTAWDGKGQSKVVGARFVGGTEFDTSVVIKHSQQQIDALDMDIEQLTLEKIEERNTFIKMIRDCTKSMIIIPLGLKFEGIGHANMMIINKRLKTIEWYEPHGSYFGGIDRDRSIYYQTAIVNEFKKLFKPLKGYKIYSPSQLMTGCPRKSGLQQYNKYLDTLQTRDTVHGRISGPEGYCVLFSMILADIRLTYPLVPPLDLMKNTIKLLTSTPEILRDFVYGYSLKLQELMKVVGDHAVEYIHLSALENPTISQRWRKEKLHKEIWEWQVKQLQEHSTCDTCHIVLDDEAHRGATLGARYRAHKEAVTPGRRLLAAQTVVSGARARERDAQMRAALAAERAALLAVSPEEKAAWHAVAIRRTQASIDQESDRPVLLTEDKAVREALSVEDEAASAPPGGKAPRRLRRL